MPIEALLDILTGRATAKLPPEIPEDATALYSFIEPDLQLLKIAVTHDKFDVVPQSGLIKTYKLAIELAPVQEQSKLDSYTGETLIGTEQWHRDV